MTKEGYVYVAKCEDRYKIGWTQNPSRRMASLQTGNPFEIELVGFIPGSMSDEERFHDHFASKRCRGEWFLLDRDDIDYILSLAPESEVPVKIQDFATFARKVQMMSTRDRKAFVSVVTNFRASN